MFGYSSRLLISSEISGEMNETNELPPGTASLLEELESTYRSDIYD